MGKKCVDTFASWESFSKFNFFHWKKNVRIRHNETYLIIHNMIWYMMQFGKIMGESKGIPRTENSNHLSKSFKFVGFRAFSSKYYESDVLMTITSYNIAKNWINTYGVTCENKNKPFQRYVPARDVRTILFHFQSGFSKRLLIYSVQYFVKITWRIL